MNVLSSLLGANKKTSLTAIGTAFFTAVTFLAGISYDQGPIALVIPVKYKPTVTYVAGFCALILWVWNGVSQKDKDVTGGTTQQNAKGEPVPESKAKLVHATKENK